MTDIVDDIFTRVKTILGDDFKGEIAVKLDNEETRIRQQWGGTESYIAMKKSKERKRQQVIKELRDGNSVASISENTGISRVHIYRLLKAR